MCGFDIRMYISSGSTSNSGSSITEKVMDIVISGSGYDSTHHQITTRIPNLNEEYNSDHLGQEITIFCLAMIVIVVCCCCFFFREVEKQ